MDQESTCRLVVLQKEAPMTCRLGAFAARLTTEARARGLLPLQAAHEERKAECGAVR